ncbi:hypothetical protein BC835DRAFT_1385230 [Cytidiella melzeri]|nr:hypothetical protein BC835DRAFT_1385230 [Cytidiella melzeri]
MQFSASLLLLGTVVTNAVHLLTVSASPCGRTELGQPNCGGQSKSPVVGYKHEVRALNTAQELDAAQAEAKQVYAQYCTYRTLAKQEEGRTIPQGWTIQRAKSAFVAHTHRQNAEIALAMYNQLQERIRLLTKKLLEELAENDKGKPTAVDEFMKDFLP